MSAEVQQRIPAAAQLVSVSSVGLAARQEHAAEQIGPGADDHDMDFEGELINAAYDAFAEHWARDDARGATGADAGCQEARTHSIAAARAKISSLHSLQGAAPPEMREHQGEKGEDPQPQTLTRPGGGSQPQRQARRHSSHHFSFTRIWAVLLQLVAVSAAGRQLGPRGSQYPLRGTRIGEAFHPGPPEGLVPSAQLHRLNPAPKGSNSGECSRQGLHTAGIARECLDASSPSGRSGGTAPACDSPSPVHRRAKALKPAGTELSHEKPAQESTNAGALRGRHVARRLPANAARPQLCQRQKAVVRGPSGTVSGHGAHPRRSLAWNCGDGLGAWRLPAATTHTTAGIPRSLELATPSCFPWI